ncbi:MAG: hypothetical protein ABR559_01205 [Gemmatimonadota bacterium]
MTRRRANLSILLVSLLAVAACSGSGPNGPRDSSGTLVIEVERPDGTPVAGASILLMPGARAATTNAQGEARLTQVAAGDYIITTRLGGGNPTNTSVAFRDPFPAAVRVTLRSGLESIQVHWDGRAVAWGAPEPLTATVSGASGGEIVWVSLDDPFLGQPTELGRGAAITTAALRPGATRVEARYVVSGTIVARATVVVTATYRQTWNVTREALVPYPDNTVGDVWVHEDHALLARRGAGGISIIQLNGAIGEVGRFGEGMGLFTQDIVASANDIAYVANERRELPFSVYLVDIASPGAPRQVGVVPTSIASTAHTVWHDNGVLYVASPFVSQAIHLFDVADPAAPRELGRVNATRGNAHDTYARDGVMYGAYLPLSAGTQGELVIANVTNPAAPAPRSFTTYPGAFTHSAWLTVDGRYLYLADETINAPIRIYDVANPAQPVLAGTYRSRLGAVPHHFQVLNGTRAYLTNYKHGVEVLDISNPVTPRLIGFFDTLEGIQADFQEDGPAGGLVPADEKGFHQYQGAWGVHWTSDGRFVVSDMQTGLHVLRFTP